MNGLKCRWRIRQHRVSRQFGLFHDNELHAVGPDAMCLFVLFIETIGGQG